MIKKIVFLFAFLYLFIANVGVASAEADGECGYIDRGWCIPAKISNESWYQPAPDHIVGKAVWYAPYIMRATAEWRGMNLDGFLGGVSLFSAGDIGEVVWLKRVGFEWEGPFLVVDASARVHMYATIINIGESVEVDFATAERWEMVKTSKNGYDYEIFDWMLRNVEVYKGLQPPLESSIPIVYADWFKDSVTFSNDYNKLWLHSMINDNIKSIEDYQIAQAMNITRPELVSRDADAIIEAISHFVIVREPYLYASQDDSKTVIANKTSIELSSLDSVAPTPMMVSLDILEKAKIEAEIVKLSIPDIQIGIRDAHNYTRKNLSIMEIVPEISWEVNCADGNAFTGFITLNECTPGVITYDSWFMRIPKHTIGVATYYAPGIVETVLKNRKMSLDGYKDGIVLMSCAHIGESVYIRRPGFGWEGPYLVIDCSQPFHMWVNVSSRHLHIEVDQERWIEWGATSGTQNIELCIGDKNCGDSPVYFWQYWDKRAEYMIPLAEVAMK